MQCNVYATGVGAVFAHERTGEGDELVTSVEELCGVETVVAVIASSCS